jgi:hypothetical protein
MKLLKILLIVFVGVPVVGTILLQFFGAIMMFGVVYQVNESISEVENLGRASNSFSPDVEIVGNAVGDRHKPGYVALSMINEMYAYRQVRVTSYVRLKDMVDAGEDLPDDEMLDAFVSARVTRLANLECDLLEKTLAAKCSVDSANASPTKNGLVNIRFLLTFIQRSEFGVVKASKKATYVEIEQSLTLGSTAKVVTLDKAAEYRSSLYERAVKLCDRLRGSEGNCGIFNVSITARPSGSTGTSQSIQAHATFSSIEAL